MLSYLDYIKLFDNWIYVGYYLNLNHIKLIKTDNFLTWIKLVKQKKRNEIYRHFFWITGVYGSKSVMPETICNISF